MYNEYEEFVKLMIKGNQEDYITTKKQMEDFIEYIKSTGVFLVTDIGEIIEVLHNSEVNVDNFNRFQILYSVFHQCETNPIETVEELEKAIKIIYIENNKCPDCGNDLRNNTYKEQREYQGNDDCYEKLNERKCSNCGWSEDN